MHELASRSGRLRDLTARCRAGMARPALRPRCTADRDVAWHRHGARRGRCAAAGGRARMARRRASRRDRLRNAHVLRVRGRARRARRGCAAARAAPRRVPQRAAVIEAVVFDLDGVLVDSEHVWDEVREQLARERGGRWHERAQADMMGMSSPEWSRYMHDVIGLTDDAGGDQRRGRAAGWKPGTQTSLPLIDGAVRGGATARGLVPARRSPRRRTARSSTSCSRRRGSSSCFEVTVTLRGGRAGQAGAGRLRRGGAKAEPRTRGGARRSRTRANGIRAAHAAGMRVIAIPNRRYPPPADALALADVILESLDQLVPAVPGG